MTYDDVGNVAGIDDQVNGENISYGYDDLDRLTSAGSPLNESVAYNQIGNITSKNGLSYSYDTIHKHAVASYNGVTYVYDANGCMTTRGSQTIKYNAERMPVKVDASGTICRFAYDGDNVRRKRLDSNGTIHYVGPYERNVGNGTDTTEVVTKYYVALGKTIAFRKGGTLYYAGTDHLGSTIRVTDATFTALDQMRYKPYGESRDAGTNLKTDHKFTSQIEDAIIGLYWCNSRAYDPITGRFVAPDTIVPGASNPQALSRYSYCFNNPMTYVDPSGRDPGDDDPQWKAEFERLHGNSPSEQDVVDRRFSLAHPGSGNNGAWTPEDWAEYYAGPGNYRITPGIVVPPGADVDENIRAAAEMGEKFLMGYRAFLNKVRPTGEWAYKQRWGTEDFGNFNFGATGRAVVPWLPKSLAEDILRRGAGVVQAFTDSYYNATVALENVAKYMVNQSLVTAAAAGSGLDIPFERPGEYRPFQPGMPGITAPFYGDSPRDQFMISVGFSYYARYY